MIPASELHLRPVQPQVAADEAERDPTIIPQELLRKYCTYAKQTCRPTFQANDYEKIAAVRPALPCTAVAGERTICHST
jgi:DNA replicative helicase MCM subunit Mcm2 (Cdc46/Mcm family)